MSFKKAHISSLIKYIGISFITGAIAHGFFSGTRQILTALFGVICFVIGTYLEEGGKKSIKVILTSAMLAIGIGAVTGGLQHFPDSPERSIVIVPIGFILSLIFFSIVHEQKISKKYAVISTIFSILLSGVIYISIESGYFGSTHSHHDASGVVQENTLYNTNTAATVIPPVLKDPELSPHDH